MPPVNSGTRRNPNVRPSTRKSGATCTARRRLLLLLTLGILAAAVMGQDDACSGDLGDTSTVEEGDENTAEAEPEAPAEPVTFGEGEASGDFALASADGTIDAPQEIRVLIGATPEQEVQVTYTATCTQGGGGAGNTDDQFTETTPIDKTIELPADDVTSCIVAASGQLQEGGDIRVRLRGTEGG